MKPSTVQSNQGIEECREAGAPFTDAEAPASSSSGAPASRRHSSALFYSMFVLIVLAAIEFACFGPIVKQIGFYLDDWTCLGELQQYSANGLIAAICDFFIKEGRVLIRPIEAAWYPLLYSWFGMNPLGYHIVNGVMEVITAWLLFKAVFELTENRTLSLLSAMLFVLYPLHDSTHYWMVANSITQSLGTSLLSLWMAIRFAKTGKRKFEWAAIGTFLLSIYNYEAFVPLCGVNILAMATVWWRAESPRLSLKQLIWKCLPSLVYYALCVASLFIYQQMISCTIGHTATPRAIRFQIGTWIHTMIRGLEVSSPHYSWPFFWDVIVKQLPTQVINLKWGWLALLTAVGTASLLVKPSENNKLAQGSIAAIFIGLATIVMSYTIFGLNNEYEPTLITFINRVNFGATVGVCMILAAAVCLIAAALGRNLPSLMQKALIPTMIAPALLVLCLVNWGYAQAWIASWTMQKHVQGLIKNNNDLRSGDSIILSGCPRYVMWSPVFDGVWDFEAMMRITKQNFELRGGVVTDRLRMSPTEITDVSFGYTCGTYPFDRLFVLLPNDREFVQVKSADEFVDLVEAKSGAFSPDKSVIQKWRQQIEKSRLAR